MDELLQLGNHHLRLHEKLRRDLGGTILQALSEPETIEIMLNPDGILWQECLGETMRPIGTMESSRAEAVMRTLATCLDTTITRAHPLIEGELPLDGSRFAGQIPPIVQAPTFAIRKRASAIFTLDDYVTQGILTLNQQNIIAEAVRNHRNILVVGGTGSGKTTLTNAIIHQMVAENAEERIVIIEDTGEIQCAAKNAVQYHTTLNVTMMHLLRLTLRMRPDRILVGEVRGPEALDLLMAWNNLGNALGAALGGGVLSLGLSNSAISIAGGGNLNSLHVR